MLGFAMVIKQLDVVYNYVKIPLTILPAIDDANGKLLGAGGLFISDQPENSGFAIFLNVTNIISDISKTQGLDLGLETLDSRVIAPDITPLYVDNKAWMNLLKGLSKVKKNMKK